MTLLSHDMASEFQTGGTYLYTPHLTYTTIKALQLLTHLVLLELRHILILLYIRLFLLLWQIHELNLLS